MICNNDFIGVGREAVNLLRCALQRILVVGNRIMDCNSGIDLREFLPGAESVLVANNTLYGNFRPLRVWDENNAGLQCKNIRFQNNLVLSPKRKADLFFFDHTRSVFKEDEKPGDIAGLLKAWQFSHNWREISPPKPEDSDAVFWIPGPKDTLKEHIAVMSRTQGDPSFLRRAKHSPLATAGWDDAALPKYVGAVPPEGMAAWNWDWTWDAFARKLLTVSQKPQDGGRFRTIGEALARVEPGMTIRVLDDAVYEEQIKIDRPAQYRGLILEAVAGKKPTLRLPKDLYPKPPISFCVGIIGVANVKLRGFRIDAAKVDHVFVTGISPGTVLENLDFVGNHNLGLVEIVDLPLSAEDAPIWIQNCTLRNPFGLGISVEARQHVAPFDKPQPCANIVIRNNDFLETLSAVNLLGAPERTLVVGNRFVYCDFCIYLADFLPQAENVLVANNTLFGNTRTALGVWDEKNAALQCKNIRFQNNLVLEHAPTPTSFSLTTNGASSTVTSSRATPPVC